MESFLKLTALVEIATEVLQVKLIKLSEKWRLNVLEEYTSSPTQDFFESHPVKKWTPEEQAMISSRNVFQWDITLCAKWLMYFQWSPLLPDALSEVEKEAIKGMKDVRNQVKHQSSNKNISKEEFGEYCMKVSSLAVTLGQDKEVIDQKIEKIKTLVMIDGELLEGNWNYDTNRILGGGSYGIVLDVKCRTDGVNYALKIIPGSDQETKKEAQNLARLNHPNVVQYKSSSSFVLPVEKFKEAVCWDQKAVAQLDEETERLLCTTFQRSTETGNMVKGLYLTMEICGKNLRNWLDSDGVNDTFSTIQERRRISTSLIKGLNYIHSQKIIHRDLRPPNILFSGPNFGHPVKIGDFGLSREVKGYVTQTMTRQAGCHLYRAPEVDENREADGKVRYSEAADYFSLGLVISEVFDPEPESKLKWKFNRIVIKKEISGVNLSEDEFFKDFVLRVTSENAQARYTCLKDTRGPLPFQPSNFNEKEAHLGRNFKKGVALADSNGNSSNIPLLPKGSKVQVQGKSLPQMSSSKERDKAVLKMKHTFIKDKDFWSETIIPVFLLKVCRRVEASRGILNLSPTESGDLKYAFNSTLHNLCKQPPYLTTDDLIENVIAVLSEIGFPDLVEQLGSSTTP